MGLTVRLSNGTVVEIDGTPFASGGEADVHEIISPTTYTKQVVKIYKLDKRTKDKEKKINYLIKNKPNLASTEGHESVIWPIHLAFIANNFVGYTMSKASGIKLELLCHQKLPKSLSKEWEKFSFNTPDSIDARLKLCFNLAVALSQIHSFGYYVLVDMKPDNIMLKPDGFISIIDIDSIEVIKNNELLFPAQVATPEYTPPEYYHKIKNIEKSVIHDTWDRFSVAIIFYRLLFGIHPFAGSLKSPFEEVTNISDIIQRGFLPVGINKDKFKVIPPPHLNFTKVEKKIQNLFLKALESSVNNENLRPTSDDWCRVLSPIPLIELNRVLPTKAKSFFLPSYTKNINLIQVPEVIIKKPIYLTESIEDGFLTKFVRLFKKSQKQLLYDSIISTQAQLDKELNLIYSLKEGLINKRTEFFDRQEDLLISEKKFIDSIKNNYKLKSTDIDKRATVYFSREIERYTVIEKSFINEVTIIETQIKDDYEIIVKFPGNNIEDTINSLKLELLSLTNKESIDIRELDNLLTKNLDEIKSKIKALENEFSQKIDNDSKAQLLNITTKRNKLKQKEKQLLMVALENYQSSFTNSGLSQHKISDDKFSIFTDSYADPDRIVKNLMTHGITSAADIKGVDESGRILKSNGSWVKVPEVALARAKRLDEWRSKKSRMSTSNPPQSLPYSEEIKIKQTLFIESQDIDKEEDLIRQEILGKKNNIPNQLLAHLQWAKEQEQKITSHIQTMKLDITKAFKDDRDKLQIKLNQLLTNQNTTNSRHNQIFENKVKPLKDKIKHLEQKKETALEQVRDEFDQLHEQLINELIQLDALFLKEVHKLNKQKSLEVEEINSVYKAVHNEYIIKINQAIHSFKSTADLLNTQQNRYNTL